MQTARRFIKMAALLLAAGTTTACASTPESSGPKRGADDDMVQIFVDNEGYSDQAIYLYGEGVKQRIGMVTGHSTTTLRIRRNRLLGNGSGVRLSTHAIGSGANSVSESLAMTRERSLRLTISPLGHLFFFPDWR